MAEGDDDSERTEEPTSKRIEDAVEKGQVAFSREVTSFLMFAFLCFLILSIVPYVGKFYLNYLTNFISKPDDIMISRENFSDFFVNIISDIIFPFSFPILIILVLVLVSSFMQNGIVISSEPLMPKLEKISLISGFKRLFSVRSIVEFLKGLAKISVVAYISYLLIDDYINEIPELPALSFMGIAKYISSLCFKLVLFSAIFMFFVSILDFAYQKYEFFKNLRMTKQEIKDEYKQSEGNPEIKAKLKQLREQKARKRMMAAVPKADVVIRNPTHFAVALEYNQEKMVAPKVVALGQDLIALTIIKIAEDNKVPIIENRPLAKALYENSSIDEEIPISYYKAVAEIIAYVFKNFPKKRS